MDRAMGPAPGPAPRWIVRPRPNPYAQLRLICFPYAGGGASIFRTWPAGLPADVEVLAIELPGRESRFKEPPIARLGALVAAMTDAIAPALQPPFALYGHSTGALIAFAFARELRRRGLPGPAHLFASGRRAPHLPDPELLHQLADPELIARLRELGGTAEAVLQEPELMAVYLPILRADLGVNEAEPFVEEPALACPITAHGGTRDDEAPPADVEAWRAHTATAFACELFEGDHFFLHGLRDAVLGALARGLAQIPR